MVLKNLTYRIPKKFRTHTFTIWERILLWLGRPVFVTLKSGKICIVFFKNGKLDWNCGHSSIAAARVYSKDMAEEKHGKSPVPKPKNTGSSSAGKEVRISVEDVKATNGAAGNSGQGNGGRGNGSQGNSSQGNSSQGNSSQGNSSQGSGGLPPLSRSPDNGIRVPRLTLTPPKKAKPVEPEDKDKKKKKEEDEPAREPWNPSFESESEFDFFESDDSDASLDNGPEYDPENTSETSVTSPKRPGGGGPGGRK